ncbi:MAG TPA: hypothetical protein VMZ90_10135 [Vicinamibacterales bacterium]|nr:hypothetical protein [Vicinamibacterales bacterium]
MSLGITAFVVSVGMISVGAQGRSFSGTWVIDGEKTMAAMEASGETRIVARGTGGGVAVGGVMSGGGGGGSVAVPRGSAAGEGRVAVGGGGRGGGGGAMVSSDTVIAIDANTFSTDIGGIHTSYPLNGSEVTVQVRGGEAKARASWKGDMLVIEQTVNAPDGPVTSTTSWFLEGDSLVRLNTRRTYYKRK